MRVSARDDQADEGRFQLRTRDEVRGDMALDMVHADQRLVRGPGEGLRGRYSDQQRSHQPRSVGDAHRVHLLQGHIRLLQGRFHHLIDLFNMLSGRDLRHHAAVHGMGGDLRVDDVRQDFPSVLHDCRRSLVAGTLDRQDAHVTAVICHSFTPPRQTAAPRSSRPGPPSPSGRSSALLQCTRPGGSGTGCNG